MFEAAERARAGDMPYFEALQPAELRALIAGRDEDGRTLLHSAAAGGHAALVQLLGQQQGAAKAVNKQDDEGWSPLHSAAATGNVAVASALIGLGADPAATTSGGQTPLHYASSKGGAEVCRLLLTHGARAAARDAVGATPLHRAAGSGKLDCARALVEEGSAAVDAADGAGATPLFVAIASGHAPVAVYLASRGARLDHPTKEGETPLGAAAADLAAELRRAAEGGEAGFTALAQRA